MLSILSVVYNDLTFDLSGVHTDVVTERCKAALVAALNRPVLGPTLGRLVNTLALQSRGDAVPFFTSFREWSPTANPAFEGQPAVATWSERPGAATVTLDDCGRNRSNVRIWVKADQSLPYGIFFEILWHELLHPTVPFTHAQTIKGQPDPPNVDNGRWYPLMTKLQNDMPQNVVDPLDNNSYRVWGETWSKLDGCSCCAPSLA